MSNVNKIIEKFKGLTCKNHVDENHFQMMLNHINTYHLVYEVFVMANNSLPENPTEKDALLALSNAMDEWDL